MTIELISTFAGYEKLAIYDVIRITESIDQYAGLLGRLAATGKREFLKKADSSWDIVGELINNSRLLELKYQGKRF